MTEQTPESQGPARAPAKRKTGAGRRTHKFPLILHPTGQFCKKIRRKRHHFGRDKQEALRRYYEQASALHTGASEPVLLPDRLTLEDLCNLYLDHRLEAGCRRRVPLQLAKGYHTLAFFRINGLTYSTDGQIVD